MRILVFNQKGGVGKTTTTINLGAALAAEGETVVIVDLDPQLHLTAAMGATGLSQSGTSEDFLCGASIAPVPVAGSPGLFLIPGKGDALSAAEGRLKPTGIAADWIIMDAPPGWNGALAELVGLSDWVICPLEPDFLGLNGLNQLMRRMQEAGQSWNRLRILISRYSNRLAVHREVRGKLIDRFGSEAVLPVVIRSSVRLAEAPGQSQTIFQYAPRSTGASDYAQLARTLLLQRALMGQG